VGKSRLVAELMVAAARSRARVLGSRCYETERILPFAPWVDALRTGQVLAEADLLNTLEPGWRGELGRLLPELPGAPDAPAAPPIGRGGNARHLFEAIGELLGRLARRHPLVIVLEDLHWADDMSLRLLAFLGRRLRTVPVLALATVREEELTESGVLRQTLDELESGGQLEQVSVPPLSHPDTIALARGLGPPDIPEPLLGSLAQEAWRVSDGNAFVVIELMHALRPGANVSGVPSLPPPGRVQDLVRPRLQRLSQRARRRVAARGVIRRPG